MTAGQSPKHGGGFIPPHMDGETAPTAHRQGGHGLRARPFSALEACQSVRGLRGRLPFGEMRICGDGGGRSLSANVLNAPELCASNG